MKILAIESSNQTMSAAVCENGRLLAEVTTNGNLQHSTQLMPAVDHVMQLAGWKPADLERIAVAKGPGSYTGVRIGATIAKTLAWTLAIPLVPISSLKVIAGNCEGAAHKLVPMIDARRGNCYTAVYQFEDNLLVERIADTHIASEEWFQRLLAEEAPICLWEKTSANTASASVNYSRNARCLRESHRLCRARAFWPHFRNPEQRRIRTHLCRLT